MQTPKHIRDAVRNTLRSIGTHLTTPQARAMEEFLVGLLRSSTAILNHFNREAEIRISKQSERYCRHLENIDITSQVEKHIFRILPEVEDFLPGIYDVRVPTHRWKYTLVVHEHIEEDQKQEPLRVLVRGVKVKIIEKYLRSLLPRREIRRLEREMAEMGVC